MAVRAALSTSSAAAVISAVVLEQSIPERVNLPLYWSWPVGPDDFDGGNFVGCLLGLEDLTGLLDGKEVGFELGFFDGDELGVELGLPDGDEVGDVVEGELEGESVELGSFVGLADGDLEGEDDGGNDGLLLGAADGDAVGAVGLFEGDDEGGAVAMTGDLVGLNDGTLLGLAEGVELGDFVGASVGDRLVLGLSDCDRLGDFEGLLVGCVGETEGEVVGLCVGVATTWADSIDTSISNEVVASALNSSLLTISLIVLDTPEESDETSYTTARVYPSSFNSLCDPVLRTAIIWSRITHLTEMPVMAS
jgi:hypothetical protein